MLTITTHDESPISTYLSLSRTYGRRPMLVSTGAGIVRVRGDRAGYISRRHSSGPWLDHRHAAALGLLILRAQHREATRERYLAGHDALSTDGRTCLKCNLPVGHHAR